MKIAFSVNGVPIRLTAERLDHIMERHPELAGGDYRIVETLSAPDIVQRGDFGTLLAAKKYNKSPVSDNKYLVVAYRELSDSDGFVLTAYYQSSLRQRVTLWKK